MAPLAAAMPEGPDGTSPRRYLREFVVGESDTAHALGSGDVLALGTPRLLAWLEAATVAAAQPHLRPGETSVGTRVDLHHIRATPVGATVRATAVLVNKFGRELVFEVTAEHEVRGHCSAIARGQVWRAVVDESRFADRLKNVS